MSNNPKVSIVLPVFNGAETIGAVLRSIVAQTEPDWELLVLDDGSTDESVAVVEGFQDSRVRVISDGTNKRTGFRRNQGTDLSASPYIAIADADDLWLPGRLERQVQFLEAHPSITLVGTSAAVVADDWKIIGQRQPPVYHDAICSSPGRGFGLIHSSILARAEFFRKYRYLDSAKRCDDQELMLRSWKFEKFANLPSIEIVYMDRFTDVKSFETRREWIAALSSNAEHISSDTYLKALRRAWFSLELERRLIDSPLSRVVKRRRNKPLSPATVSELQLWIESLVR